MHSGEIEDFARDAGYKSSNATRRCRELENAGLIKAVYIKGCVSYQPTHNPLEIEKEIKPPLAFGDKKSIHRLKWTR